MRRGAAVGWVVRQGAALGKVVRDGRALRVRSRVRSRVHSLARSLRRRGARQQRDEPAGEVRNAGLAPGGSGSQRGAEGVDVPGREFFPRRALERATRCAASQRPRTMLEGVLQWLLHAE